MSGQISFGNQLQFFISIDWVLSNTLATDNTDKDHMNMNGDECHSSTKAPIPPKKDADPVIGH